MVSGSSNMGLHIREVSSTTRANEPPLLHEVDSPSQHTSLGRLLRLLADPRSNDSHMEAAIEHVEGTSHVHGGSGSGGKSVEPQKPPVRVFSLSDHHQINNLELIVRAVKRANKEALSGNSKHAPTADAMAAKNLLRALAGALTTQSVEECASTKRNLCVWTSASKKRLLLLDFMLRCGSDDGHGEDDPAMAWPAATVLLRDVLCQALTSTEGPVAQRKTDQMAASLVVFELAQRVRRRGQRSQCGGPADWVVLLDSLLQIVHTSSVQTPSEGTKPSKLGQVALDALLAVLCVAGSGSTGQSTLAIQRAMATALRTFIAWNVRSSERRQWLLVAVRQLLDMVAAWDPKTTNAVVAQEMVMWHWNATAMWFCDRSDSVLTAKKTLVKATQQSIDELHQLVVVGACGNRRETNIQQEFPHVVVASLRRLCALLSLHAGGTLELRQSVFSSGVSLAGKLVIALISCLTMPLPRSLAQDLLRLVVVGSYSDNDGRIEPLLVLSPPEREALVSLVVRCIARAKSSSSCCDDDHGAVFLLTSKKQSPAQDLDLSVISFQDTVVEMLESTDHHRDPAETHVLLSMVGNVLDGWEGSRSSHHHAFFRQRRRVVTQTVLRMIHYHPIRAIRIQAASLIPRLDLELCMQYTALQLLGKDADLVDSRTCGRIVALLFLCVAHDAAKTHELAHVLMGALCHGQAVVHQEAITSPAELAVQGRPPVAATEPAVAPNLELLLGRSVHRDGWCMQVSSRPARTAVVAVLIRALFDSPRDSHVLTWLRELSRLGWFDDGNGDDDDDDASQQLLLLQDVLLMLTRHMQTLPRLTDELVDEDSPRASRAVEKLLFARLAPNLVLRVIPREAFYKLFYHHKPAVTLCGVSPAEEIQRGSDVATCSSLAALVGLLWSQVLDPLEYKDVKMLSIELLTKLPMQAILPHVLHQLAAFLQGQGAPTLPLVDSVFQQHGCCHPCGGDGGGFTTAKLMMYYLNRIFSTASGGGGSGVAMDSQGDGCVFVDNIVAVLLTVLSLSVDKNETFSVEKSPLVDLQMGAMECLALLMVRSLQQNAATSTVEDAVVTTILASDSSLLTHSIGDLVALEQLRICCCNVLLSTLAKLGDNTANAYALQNFQKRILQGKMTPNLLATRPPARVLAGCLQIAFTFFFKNGEFMDQTDASSTQLGFDCVRLISGILNQYPHEEEQEQEQEGSDQVYFNALKLLGALVGKISWLWQALPQEDTKIQASIATGLQKLRDTKRQAIPFPVRQLAQSLLHAISSPVPPSTS